MTSRSIRPRLFGLVAVATSAAALAAGAAFAQYHSLFRSSLDGWVIENTEGGNIGLGEDVIRVTGPDGWLRSENTYADFRLRVEFRYLTDDADSGIFIRAANEDEFMRGWPNQSYQVQLRNPEAPSPFPPVGGLFRHGMPDGPIQYNPADAERLSLGVDEWQTLEIEAIGTGLKVSLNGELLMLAQEIAIPSGYIGIQGEAGVIEIRAIAIEEVAVTAP